MGHGIAHQMTIAFAVKTMIRTFKRALAIILISIVLVPSTHGSLFETEVEFEAFNSEDIDFFLANFEKLTTAIDTFLGKKTFEDAINVWGDRFDESLDCLAIHGAQKLETSFKSSLPNWSIFFDRAQKSCKNEGVIKWGEGGTADNFRYTSCIIHESISANEYDFDQLSRAYQGLKTIAKAEMCSAKHLPISSPEFETAKRDIGYAGIRSLLWSQVNKIDGCESTKDTKRCLIAYMNKNLNELKSLNSLDSEKYPEIVLSTINTLKIRDSQSFLKRIRTLLGFENALDTDSFVTYETAAIQSLKVLEVSLARANKRHQLESKLKPLKETYLSTTQFECQNPLPLVSQSKYKINLARASQTCEVLKNDLVNNEILSITEFSDACKAVTFRYSQVDRKHGQCAMLELFRQWGTMQAQQAISNFGGPSAIPVWSK